MINIIQNSRVLLVYLIPFSLGVLSVLGFSPFNYTFVNFLIFPCLFLILSFVRKKSKNKYRKKPYLKNLFLVGYSFGVGFFLSGTHWISYSLTFDEIFFYLIPVSLILLPMFLALFFGFASLVSGFFIKNDFVSIIIFITSFSSIDYIRSKIFTGFPWNLWAYSWVEHIEIIQLLNLVGLFGFNLLAISTFCLPLLLFMGNKKRNLIIISFWLFLFFSNYIFGSISINRNNIELSEVKKKDDQIIKFKIISPDIDLKYNLSTIELEELINKLIRFSEPEKNLNTIFIWPEGVFTGYNLSDISEFDYLFKKNFSKKHRIIFGVSALGGEPSNFYNSLVLIDHNFQIINQYNKKKLVPFGEFLPFENILQKIGLKKITQGYGSFINGGNQKNINIFDYQILPLICYEIIFPELTQNSPENTNLIVNISEDAWFGKSIGPHQHFSKSIFRAIESNLFVLRSANKGFSAIINNKGQVVKSLTPSERGNIEMEIPLINNSIKNKNDLIFFVLLFTYILFVFTIKIKFNDKK
ncbi:MAG: apolipoprotein N-acyltransferase [Candidatus Pelagibacter sp. TMED165]|nr:MAG: apolipoprotein N-acyltransferase [Candidatus Pelagibacter sp. TMED165]